MNRATAFIVILLVTGALGWAIRDLARSPYDHPPRPGAIILPIYVNGVMVGYVYNSPVVTGLNPRDPEMD